MKYFLLLLGFCLPYWLIAQTLPPGFVQDRVVDGLNPVAMTLDHHGRIWIAEKDGLVRIVNEAGQLIQTPFINLPVDDYNERGLLGIALHPDFDHEPWVYLYYTVPGANRNRLSRFLANGDLAIPNSEEILMEFDSLQSYIHNGGALMFGQDNMLYIAIGEGADPAKAPDLSSFHGKILRLHLTGGIPPDNPYYSQLQGNYRAIYATGFRNPFTLTYDPRADRLWTGDVGGGDFEEIDLIEAGKDYGWPTVEGPRTNQPVGLNYEDPLIAYDHNTGCAVTAVLHIPDSFEAVPAVFRGRMLWGDYCEGFIHWQDSSGMTQTFATGMDRPIGMLVDEYNDCIYYLSRAGLGGGSPADNTSTNQGALWKIRYVGDGPPHISRQPQSALVPVGEGITFTLTAQGTQPLQYQWYRNGEALPSDTTSDLTIEEVNLAMDGDQIRCVVSNAFGSDSSDIAHLDVTSNQRPVPQIIKPDSQLLFRAGDTLHFSGIGEDPETGILPDSSLIWWVDLHHDLHTHPGAGPFLGVSNGSWVVPTIYETDPNIWYRINVAATDSAGLTGVGHRDIFPDLTMIFLDGPTGIQVNLDGRTLTVPTQIPGMIGLQRVALAPKAQIVNDSLYEFVSWDDGSTDLLRRELTPEAGLSMALLYRSIGLGQGRGLTGRYYLSPNLDFSSDPVLTRIDPEINFFWGGDSPAPGLPNDYFTVRWTGEVEAIFDEAYTFTVRSDDGVRLWVDGELLIDQWVAQAPTETSDSIQLKGQTRYPIVLEYMEIEGGAEVNLFWASPSTMKEVIPQRQLYPETEQPTGLLRGEIWLDLNQNGRFDGFESTLVGHLVHLYHNENHVQTVLTDSLGQYAFVLEDSGKYHVRADMTHEGTRLGAGIGLNFDGSTPSIFLDQGDTLVQNLPLFRTDEGLFQAFPMMRVYPNPFEDSFTLEYSQWLEGEVRMEIRDVTGRLVREYSGESGAGSHTREISGKTLAAGVYALTLVQDHHQRSHLILKGKD